MKKIVIVMDRGICDSSVIVATGRVITLEARYDDGEVLRGGEDTAFLGRLEISQKSHGDLMPVDQIRGFITSVVLPQLDLFSRQLETEAIEEEEVALETEVGPAP